MELEDNRHTVKPHPGMRLFLASASVRGRVEELTDLVGSGASVAVAGIPYRALRDGQAIVVRNGGSTMIDLY